MEIPIKDQNHQTLYKVCLTYSYPSPQIDSDGKSLQADQEVNFLA